MKKLRMLAAVGALVLTGFVAGATPATAAGPGYHVPIPRSYVYNPSTKKNPTLHDYCTKSPDWYNGARKNADFRGPCARHDMCIERGGNRPACDNQLRNDLYAECNYTYRGNGFAFGNRHGCIRTADIYFIAVRANTFFNG